MTLIVLPASKARFVRVFVPFLFSLASCGSGGGGTQSEVTFGGAQCESGTSFSQTSSKGYDELYNFENDPNPPVRVVFNTTDQSAECANLVTAEQVLPWVRIDFQDYNTNQDALTFELVQHGGRNSPVLATFDIPDSSKESIHGTFAYRTEVGSDLVCEVNYSGSYCPHAATSQTHFETTFIFSAQGTADCTLAAQNGGAATACHGIISATNVTLNQGYYGE